MARVRGEHWKLMGWKAGWDEWWRWRRLWRDSAALSYLSKSRSMSFLQCVRVSTCAAGRRSPGGSQWKKWCAKDRRDAEEAIVLRREQKCTGSGLWVNASTWASKTLKSISQMESLPNGPWQCSILRVVSYAANILHSRRKQTGF